MADRPPVWFFLAVAAAIAFVAFAVAQMVAGAGMIVVLVAITVWCCLAQQRWERKIRG
jgi:predicted membrane metal-binding protein